MAETFADLLREAGLEDSNRARRGEYTPGPYRRGYRPGAEIAPYYPPRRVPTEADRDTMRAVDRMRPAQSEPLGHSRLEQMGRDAFEVTGLPSFRRAGRAFASGDPVGGAGEAAMGTLGLTGLAAMRPSPRAAVRTPLRQPQSMPRPLGRASDGSVLPMREPQPFRRTEARSADLREGASGDPFGDAQWLANRRQSAPAATQAPSAIGSNAASRIEVAKDAGPRGRSLYEFDGPQGSRYRVRVDPDNLEPGTQGGASVSVESLTANDQYAVQGNTFSPAEVREIYRSIQEAIEMDARTHGRSIYNIGGIDGRRGRLHVRMAQREARRGSLPSGYALDEPFDGGRGVYVRREPPPLPMDEASRMGRAREMGFDVDTPLYHGTAAEFDRFDLRHRSDGVDGVHLTSDPARASLYADKERARGASNERVLPLFARDAERVGDGHYVVRDPRNIRSRFAAFDPSRSGESDLLAAPQRNIPPPGSRGAPPPQPPQGGFFNARVPEMQQRQPRVTEGQAPNYPPNADAVLADTRGPRPANSGRRPPEFPGSAAAPYTMSEFPFPDFGRPRPNLYVAARRPEPTRRYSFADRKSILRAIDAERAGGARIGSGTYLTMREQQLLDALRARPHATREELLRMIYRGVDEPEPKIIDVFMRKLAQRVGVFE